MKTKIEVREVAWDDPAAVALRAAMETEMERRYEGRLDLLDHVGDVSRLTFSICMEKVL